MIDLLKGIWPFISEIFFAGKSFKNIVLENKVLSLVLAFLLISLAINYMALSKIWDIAVANRKEKTSTVPKTQPSELVIDPPRPVQTDQIVPCATKHEDTMRKKLEDIYKE